MASIDSDNEFGDSNDVSKPGNYGGNLEVCECSEENGPYELYSQEEISSFYEGEIEIGVWYSMPLQSYLDVRGYTKSSWIYENRRKVRKLYCVVRRYYEGEQGKLVAYQFYPIEENWPESDTTLIYVTRRHDTNKHTGMKRRSALMKDMAKLCVNQAPRWLTEWLSDQKIPPVHSRKGRGSP
jgi:hypothetical protein